MGRDRQRIAAAVVVAGDRGDSDREGRRADFVLQPEGDLVFAFDNRRCHSEDVVSALNSGELDGEAGFGLACEEEVGRERSGLQVSVQSSEIVQGFRVRPALLMVKVLLAVPVKLPLPVTVTVTVPALMQSSL